MQGFIKTGQGILLFLKHPVVPRLGFFGQRWLFFVSFASLLAGYGITLHGFEVISQASYLLNQQNIQSGLVYQQIYKDIDLWERASLASGSWAESVGDSGQIYEQSGYHGMDVAPSLGIEVHQHNEKLLILYPHTKILQWNNQSIVVELDQVPVFACSMILLIPSLYQQANIDLPDLSDPDHSAILANNHLLMNQSGSWCMGNRSPSGDRIILTFPRIAGAS